MPDQPSYPETLQACHARIAELEARLAHYQASADQQSRSEGNGIASSASQNSLPTMLEQNHTSQQHLQMLLTHLPIIVFTLDKEGVFTSSEGSGLASIGLQPGQVVGTSVYSLYANSPDVLAYIQRALTGENFKNESYVAEIDSYFESYYAPLYDSNGQLQGAMGVSYNISERKHNQRRLEQAQQLAKLAEFTYDVAAGVSRASLTLFALYGLEPADSITIESIRPLMTPKDFSDLEHSFTTTLQTGKTQATEYRIITPAGQARDIYSVWEAMYGPQGQISHVFGMVQDISERKHAERDLYDKQLLLEAAQHTLKQANHELQQANAHLALLQRVNDALQAANDLEDILTAVLEPLGSQATASLFYTLNNDLGQPEHITLKAHRGIDLPIALGSVLSLEQFSGATLYFATPDKPLVLADALNDPRINAATRAAHIHFRLSSLVSVPLRQGSNWVGILQLSWQTPRDFSPSEQAYFAALPAMLAPVLANYRLLESLEQRAIERSRQLEESRHLLRATIDNASSVVFVKDIQGRYILANKRLETFLDRPMQNIIGSNDYDILPPAIAEEVRRNDQQVMANGQAVTVEECIPSAEGERIFLATKFPLFDDDGQMFALGCITTDISEQKIAEAKVQAYRDQLAKAQTEVQITQRIQELLLPDISELQAIHELDIAGYMKPAEHIGGDYYDILRIGDSVKIGIGDVTGHGLESGLLMLMTQTAVRTLLSSNERDPRRMMSILNRTVFDNLQRMHVDKSLTLSLFDYCQGVLRVSGQHEYVVMMRQGGEIEVVDTIDLGVPLGLEADISRFINEQVLPLQPGEGAILFTDGITEAENIAGEQFGLPRLVALAKEHWQSPAAQISQAIVHSVEQHIAGHTVYDDITLVVLKRPQPEDIATAAHA